ncbi:MAG: MFS transporter [Hylemonella sp.]|nr:MFS transporter [Hylemonella sp.]
MNELTKKDAIVVFLAFAFAYFFSALIRAITATLSPTLTEEFDLSARQLGLLAGGYFLGFAATQLPLGGLLDKYGPKRVLLSFLSVAVLGCIAFSAAGSFEGLLMARVMSGVGVSACLMAPLTGYRRWISPAGQLRANSWMLMTGSLGMVGATLPVQWLAPILGWRALFWIMAAMVVFAMLLIAWKVPDTPTVAADTAVPRSYREVWRHPYFKKMIPLGFFTYGGLLAIQTLWVIPWMIRVTGYSPWEAAQGLFWINVAMLGTFWTWGLLNPWLVRKGYSADRLIARGVPLSFVLLIGIIAGGEALGQATAWLWALYCMSSTFVALAQPAVGMMFPGELAGRALSAYNLVIFSGVFAMQWGIGLMVDGLMALGWSESGAFQGAMTVFLLGSVGAYLYFLSAKSHNQRP